MNKQFQGSKKKARKAAFLKRESERKARLNNILNNQRILVLGNPTPQIAMLEKMMALENKMKQPMILPYELLGKRRP